MRKLALNDEILLKIEKPARYIGNEVNSVMKDPSKVDIRFAMCFPDVQEHMFLYKYSWLYIVLDCSMQYYIQGFRDIKQDCTIWIDTVTSDDL